jgi:hypothetical protein
MTRQPFTPAEFDAACRELERSCPWVWQTSGYRSTEHNADVGGHVMSKHAILPCMARDYVAKDQAGLEQCANKARGLGLWVIVHDVGSGNHVHVQGLPTGPPPEWWLAKYGV